VVIVDDEQSLMIELPQRVDDLWIDR
jgi:hypothetical protein